MLKAQGTADNHVVWMSHPDFDPVNHAFAVMDDWLIQMRLNPKAGAVGNRPKFAADTCFNAKGDVIERGADVWDGEWNHRPQGACMAIYPNYKTSREIAGASIEGDIFKCQRQSVTAAISAGVYGDLDVWPYLEELETAFPSGVCDYSLADAGRPEDLLKVFTLASEAEVAPREAAQVKLKESDSQSPVGPKTITLSQLDTPADLEVGD